MLCRTSWRFGMLADVSLWEFPPGRVPEVAFDRLNGHYRGVVALARLVLRHGAPSSRDGEWYGPAAS